MPRKSAASAVAPIIDVKQRRIDAPADLGDVERKLFSELVASCDPSHFRHSDRPLLARYCEAVILAEWAALELRQGGPVLGGRASPWLTVQEKAVRAMTALSMRLRLSPQSRLDPKSAAREKSMSPHTKRPWEFD